MKAFCFVAGLFFAWLQLGEFLMLELFYSSSVLTYLAVTAAWLVGSTVGLSLKPVRLAWQVSIQLGCLFMLSAMLQWTAPDGLAAAFHWVWVFVTGWGVGAFYQRWQNSLPRVDLFLLWESNGFIAGIPAVVASYAWGGRPALFVGASLLAVALMGWRGLPDCPPESCTAGTEAPL